MEGQNGVGTPVFARMRDCACPGTPHAEEGDGCFLRPTVSLRGGMALEAELVAAASEASGDAVSLASEINARWMIVLLRHEVLGWNLVGEEGVPVPFDAEVLVNDYNMARLVADAAAELYTDTVLVPLTARLSGTSRNGSKATSMSPAAQSIKPRRRRSSRATSAATKRSSG